jgi:hypothetical protein
MGWRLVLAVVVAAAVVAPASATGKARSRARAASPDLTAYAGVGTWLDIYAGKAAWRNPAREVAAMARDGAQTLYLQTGNYRQSVDVVRRRAQGRFIEAAHAAGLQVVAWYLPSFANLRQDERRALAAIHFQSPSGERFDGFALDIEATTVRPISLRNRRLLQVSTWLRSAVGTGYALGAITPSPIGMSRSYWPHIPYRALGRLYDVFLPMAYSTLRGVQGADSTLAYLSATVAAVRAGIGNPAIPIHLIGGLAGGMGARETTGFMRAVADCVPLGYSLYAFPSTRRATWTALNTPLPAQPASSPACACGGATCRTGSLRSWPRCCPSCSSTSRCSCSAGATAAAGTSGSSASSAPGTGSSLPKRARDPAQLRAVEVAAHGDHELVRERPEVR